MAIDVEEAIQEAQRDGRFNNLPGQGQPLNIDPSPDAVVNNLLKEAHVRPEWIEVGCLIDALQERTGRYYEQFRHHYEAEWRKITLQDQKAKHLTGWRRWWHILWHGSGNRLQSPKHGDPLTNFNRRWMAGITRYATLLHETNIQIRRFNYLVPQRDLQRHMIPVRQRLEEFTSNFPQAAQRDLGVVPMTAEVPTHLLQSESAKGHLPPNGPCAVRCQQLQEASKR